MLPSEVFWHYRIAASDAPSPEGEREAVSRDAAEVEYGHVASARGERREDGLPDGSQGGRAGEKAHSVSALAEWAADLAEPIKPELRGWLHAGMVPAALIAGVVLVCLARTPQAVLACAVYSVTALLLFATSAVYHRGGRSPRPSRSTVWR